MSFVGKRKHRTIGTLKPQDHSNRRLVQILASVGLGLAALFTLAYVIAWLDGDYDNQELPQPSNTQQHS